MSGRKRSSKKRSLARGVRVTVWFPQNVLQALDHACVEQGCSRSWLLTSAACQMLGISEASIAELRGYEIPKEFANRVGAWSPNTKAAKEETKPKKPKGPKGPRMPKACSRRIVDCTPQTPKEFACRDCGMAYKTTLVSLAATELCRACFLLVARPGDLAGAAALRLSDKDYIQKGGWF